MRPAKDSKIAGVLIDRLLHAVVEKATVLWSVGGESIGWKATLANELDVFALTGLYRTETESPNVMLALLRMHRKGDTGVQAFENELRAILADKHRARGQASVQCVILPITCAASDDLKLPIRFSIMGEKVVLTPWKNVRRRYGGKKIDEALQQVLKRDVAKGTQCCLLFKHQGLQELATFEAIAPAFDAFRGMLELTHSFGTSRYTSGPMPHSAFPHPPWMLIADRSSVSAWGFNIDAETKEAEAAELGNELINVVRDRLRSYVRSSDERAIDTVIAESLRLYVQGLDSSHWHYRFLSLFQCVETMTLVGDHGGDSGRLKSRFEYLLAGTALDPIAVRQSIDWLIDKRNKIVHKGLHAEANFETCTCLKVFCDGAFGSLFRYRNRLRERLTLEKLFDLTIRPEPHIDATEKALRALRKSGDAPNP